MYARSIHMHTSVVRMKKAMLNMLCAVSQHGTPTDRVHATCTHIPKGASKVEITFGITLGTAA